MQPLVSVIITTKNEESVLSDLLTSLTKQTYPHIELIVIDNTSTDKTVAIAENYTKHIYTKGPERSAQRNYGASKSKGTYLLFLDADMVVTKRVIEQAVKIITQEKTGGVIIPEQSFGEGFWTHVKAYERSFYIGDDTIEAARFYPRTVFNKMGGFDETINGPEDWDLSDRVRKVHGISRIPNVILHNEGRLTLWGLMKKKYYYGLRTHHYMKKNNISPGSSKIFFFLRSAYWKNPLKIIQNPLLFLSMFFMLLCEFVAGSFGFVVGKYSHS